MKETTHRLLCGLSSCNGLRPAGLAGLLVVCCWAAVAAAQGPGGQPNTGATARVCQDAVCGQVIVQLHPGQSIAAVNAGFGTSTVGSISGHDLFLLELPPHASAKVAVNMLTGDARVAWAELNYMVVAPGGGTQSFFLSASADSYHDQEILADVGADRVHRWATGRGEIVAVLDTGVDPHHPLFAERLAPGGFNYLDANHDFSDDGEGELAGHGTLVSGLILRVAPEADILPMKVLDGDGVGTSFAVAHAIYDAVALNAGTINLSLGTIRPSQAIAQAAQAALDSGVLLVAAAGNFDRSEPRFYPAGFDHVLSVAGTGERDVKASFSDFGSWIDIAAPAVNLVGPFPGGEYASNSGTSLAAAVVSGSAALVRSQQPSLTPERLSEILLASSDDIDEVNYAYAGLLGSGRVNVFRAVLRPVPMEPIRR